MDVADALRYHLATEKRRLDECIQEPIRTPGRIQGHGILMAVEPSTGTIVVVSENAVDWLGRAASELGSASLDWAIESGSSIDPARVVVNGGDYDAIVFHASGLAIVELEPVADVPAYARTAAVQAIEHLLSIDDIDELIFAAADEVRRVSGHDRVLIYRFHEDGHGEVVGESQNPAAVFEPYVGLRFPASDIPLQARALYVSKRSRQIASTSADTVALISLDPTLPPLDLSASELRAVSVHHIEFMRNMHQAATVSLALVHEDRLIGMITCAHAADRRIPVLLRRALEVIALTLTRQLVSLEQIERLRRELDSSSRRAELLAPLAAPGDVASALLEGDLTIRDLVPADAVIVRIDGTVRSSGDLPVGDVGVLLDVVGHEEISTESVSTSHPDIAALVPGFAGLLSIPLGPGGDALVFLRREVAQVVRWLGDISESNRDTPLSPRRSFSEWKQSVSGSSLPWLDAAAEAAALAPALRDILARRSDAELARVAMIDPLTGIHNRRFLAEQLHHGDQGERHDAALLFIDLDDFKQVNDHHGHEVGDTVLRHVAQRLLAASRSGDIVARLGGDEFVVLCRDITPGAARELGKRLVEAVADPIDLEGMELRVRASIGVAHASRDDDLLVAGDLAMYRAKRAGRNRASD